MTTNQADAGVQLDVPCRIDRFFPDCVLGLVEFWARLKHGVPDLKQAWFSNTFEYSRKATGGWIKANGIEFCGTIQATGDPREEALVRLRAQHGIDVEVVIFTDFDALMVEVIGTIRSGAPALACFDMAQLQGPTRAGVTFRPHMIGVVGWDPVQQQLRAVEQVCGEIIVPIDDYRDCFRRFALHSCEFEVVRCSRREARVEAVRPGSCLDAVHRALDNLYSELPGLGLNALRSLRRDVERAVQEEQRPFSIPGLWFFSHDRHALRQGLPYWEVAGVAPAAELARLRQALEQAFATWFEIDMTIERSLHECSGAHMQRVSSLLGDVVPIEEHLAAVLRDIAACGHHEAEQRATDCA